MKRIPKLGTSKEIIPGEIYRFNNTLLQACLSVSEVLNIPTTTPCIECYFNANPGCGHVRCGHKGVHYIWRKVDDNNTEEGN